jgi:hypothetical protein
MAIGDGLAYLMAWYASHCDGDWEHQFGVTINTLDNPGWHLKIDLAETELEGVRIEDLGADAEATAWARWWSDGSTFEGAAGPASLGDLLDSFRMFSEATSNRMTTR